MFKSGIEQPDFICPGVEYELDVVVSNYSGLYSSCAFVGGCVPAWQLHCWTLMVPARIVMFNKGKELLSAAKHA